MDKYNTNIYRICIIEDDEDVLNYLDIMIRKNLKTQTLLFNNTKNIIPEIIEFTPDLIITDIEIPETNGLEIVEQLHKQKPNIPVIVMTAHASIDYTITALKNNVKDFLTKPIDSPKLIGSIVKVIEENKQNLTNQQEKILAIGAHPDDIEIGIGGTLAAHHAAGDTIHILTLSSGNIGGDQQIRQKESEKAAQILGAHLTWGRLEDTHISHTNPTIGIIEQAILKIQPNIIYTHSKNDRHSDHNATHAATIVAARKTPKIYCFQSPSSTIEYRPNKFINITPYCDKKLELLRCFESQNSIRTYLQEDMILATAQYWSRYGEEKYYEPLETIRETNTIKPHN